MNTSNLGWLTENENRAYPIAENSTCKSDSGLRLPTSYISDISITAPESHLNIRLAAFGVTPKLVSLVIASDSGPMLVGTFLRSSLGLPLTLMPVVPGVAGVVVLGSGVANAGNVILRFGSAAQTGIEASAVSISYGTGVESINRKGNTSNTAATGAVEFRGGPGVDTYGSSGSVVTLSLSEFAALKLNRDIESTLNCGIKPILTINGVGADSDGRILIRFL